MHVTFPSILALLSLSTVAYAGCPAGSKKFVINFDKAPGRKIRNGERISDQWEGWGVLFSGSRRIGNRGTTFEDTPALRIFNSNKPRGEEDLGSPNDGCKQCQGPYAQCPGKSRDPNNAASTTNCKKQRKILIIETGRWRPNDYQFGGEINITFTAQVTKVLSIGVMDVEHSLSSYTVFGPNDQVLKQRQINGKGDNTWQNAWIGTTGSISRVRLDIHGSFGLTHFRFCAASGATPPAPTVPPTEPTEPPTEPTEPPTEPTEPPTEPTEPPTEPTEPPTNAYGTTEPPTEPTEPPTEPTEPPTEPTEPPTEPTEPPSEPTEPPTQPTEPPTEPTEPPTEPTEPPTEPTEPPTEPTEAPITPRPTEAPATEVPPAPPVVPPPCEIPKTIPDECEVELLLNMMEIAIFENRTLAPQWVRAGFHDAGTWNQLENEGGANGCLMNEPGMLADVTEENAHLDTSVETLRALKSNWEQSESTCIAVSSADIIQVAARFGAALQIEPGEKWSESPVVRELMEVFEWGRPDEPNCDVDWVANLPTFKTDTAHGTTPNVKRARERCQFAGQEIELKMMGRNGFTIQEATALMGAHTFGEFRGTFGQIFRNPWVENGADDSSPHGGRFDNEFHRFLILGILATTMAEFEDPDASIGPDPLTPMIQWWLRDVTGSRQLNLLDTDLALAFPSDGVYPDFHEWTIKYADNLELFLEHFFDALDKMSKLGVTVPLSLPTKLCSSDVTLSEAEQQEFEDELETAIEDAAEVVKEKENALEEEHERLSESVELENLRTVEGVAEDEEGEPLAGVEVALVAPNGTVVASNETDPNGEFVIDEVPPDDFTLKLVEETGPTADPAPVTSAPVAPMPAPAPVTNAPIEPDLGPGEVEVDLTTVGVQNVTLVVPDP